MQQHNKYRIAVATEYHYHHHPHYKVRKAPEEFDTDANESFIPKAQGHLIVLLASCVIPPTHNTMYVYLFLSSCPVYVTCN